MRKFRPVPISMPPDMVDLVDARALALGLSRSGYLQQLIRRDVGMGSMLAPGLAEDATPYTTVPAPKSKKPPSKRTRRAEE